MFRYLLAVLALSSAAAFTPAPVSRIAMSRVIEPAAPLAVQRVAFAPEMSAVTERDADGNPVVHTEMCVAHLLLNSAETDESPRHPSGTCP